MRIAAFFDELTKLGAISDEQAQASIDRLEALEKQRPTVGQVARYGTVGALSGAGIGALGNAIEGKPTTPRGLAAAAVRGALVSGAVPLVTRGLDRRSEVGKLRKYMVQEHVGDYGKNPASPAGPPNFERLES